MKSIFSKFLVLLLVVGLLFAVAPTKQAEAQTPTTLNVAQWSATAPVGVNGRPTVLLDGTTYHMWYGLDLAGGVTELYYTTSTTPGSFTAGTKVTFNIAPLEQSSVTVIKETDGFKMIAYGTGNQVFALYTSSDGIAWTKGATVFDATGMTDLGKIDAPFVFNDGGVYKLYFQKKSADGQSYKIYLATSSTVGGTYTLANSSNPVLSPSANIADWDGKFVMHPTVVKDGATYYMWFSAHNTVLPQRIGLATSSDGINWTKSPANPVIGPTGEPSVIKNGNTWQMWYLGGATQYVSATGPFEFQTIQAAINAAADGDVIEVAPGTYAELVTVDKDITLSGPNAAITGDGTRVEEAILTFPDGLTELEPKLITVNSDHVTIVGMKFEDMAYVQPLVPYHIYTLDADNLTVKNNLFIGGEIPIYRDPYVNAINPDNTGWLIENNKFVGGPFVNSEIARAMYIYKTGATIQNNVIEGYGVGIQILPATAAIGGEVKNNTIAAGHIGLYHNGHDKGAGAWTYSGNTITVAPNNRAANQDIYSPIAVDATVNFRAIQITNFGKGGTGNLPTVTFSNNVADLQPEATSSLSEKIAVRLNLTSAEGTTVTLEKNSFVNYTVAVRNETVTAVDASPNWWGSEFGPQGVVTGDIQVIQWCADEGCKTFAPEAGLITLNSDDSQIGAIKIFVPGISYYLTPGTVLQNSSPCFEVYANDVMIYTDYPAAAKCVPTNGSDGIWVADAVQNLRVINLEFDGTGQTTGSGIFFSGGAVGFQVVDNYFHDLDVSGVVFTGTPSGSTMDIQGNLFQDLGAAAIVSPAAINAEYNSWGVYAGATLTNVDTEPHTHADFYMEYEGVIPLEKVAVGNTIKYTVYGNLQNISGAQFTLKFPTGILDAGTPTNLSSFVAAGTVPLFVVDETAGTITFNGYAATAVTGQNVPIYEVVFTGTAAGTGAINFDQTNDAFAMFPGYGPSTWVYAAGYVDRTVEVFVDSAAPTLTSWTPDEGDIYLAEGEDFVLTVDALDDNLFSLEIDHNVTALPEFTVYASATNVYGSTAAQTAFEAAGLIVTYDESTQTWTLTFDSAGSALAALLAKQDVVFYAVLHDQAGKTWGSMDPTTDDNTFEYTIVFDNTAPTLDSWSPIKDMTYMLTPSGDFVVTVDAADVNLYELEIDNSLEPGLPQFSVYADETDPYGGDGAQFSEAGVEVTYNALTQTWVLTFENGGAALDAIIANQGITFYAVIHDLAGNKWGSMYDVEEFNTFAYTLYQQQPIARADSTGGAVVAVVSADGNTIDFTGEVDWYPADPDLGRTSGHRIGVRLSAPELDFGTADTTFTFNGQTYDWDLVKDGDDYVLVYPKVTAPIQTWEIVVTWGGGFSQTFMVNFNGTLGPVTAYTVDGEISMQGRVARNTEDVITLDGYELDDFTADSLDKLGINYTLSDVLTGEYTIVTNQPRYLNIYCNEDSTDAIPDFCKKITLISDRTLPTLWLRGGNAIWTDNEITLDDANKVGTDWGSTADPDGNVNFDGIVNIQDLALVGGNYGLTSADADAYGTWAP